MLHAPLEPNEGVSLASRVGGLVALARRVIPLAAASFALGYRHARLAVLAAKRRLDPSRHRRLRLHFLDRGLDGLDILEGLFASVGLLDPETERQLRREYSLRRELAKANAVLMVDASPMTRALRRLARQAQFVGAN